MRRPRFSLKTLFWLTTLIAVAAGLITDAVREPGEHGRAFVQWLLFGGVLGLLWLSRFGKEHRGSDDCS